MTRIMIVDDNEQHLNLLQILFETHDCEVIQAMNGVEALERAREDPPEVIVTDILMPVMDGFSLCRQWKSDDQLKEIPLVFYTGTFIDPEDKNFALSLGAERFIVKPEEPEALVEIVHEVIKEFKARRFTASAQLIQEDEIYYQEYNEALIRKLEDKVVELEDTKRDLESEISEHMWSRRELRALDERYHTLVSQMGNGFALHEILCDESGLPFDYKFLDVNQAFETMTGLKAAEIIGKTVLEVLPKTESYWIDIYGKVALSGESVRFENYSQELDKYFEVLAFSPQRNHFAAVFTDITERIKADEAQRLTQFAIDHTGDAAFWMRADARFVYVNDEACRSLGYARDELLSMSVHDIDPNFPEQDWSTHWEEVRQRESFAFESHHRTKDGREFPVEVTENYLEYKAQEFNCAFARDITERKQADIAIRESETRFRSIYSQSPVGIELYDLEGRLIEANDACLMLFGVTDTNSIKGIRLFDDPNLPEDAKQSLLAGEDVKFETEFDFDLVRERNLYETTKTGRCDISVHISSWQIGEPRKGGYLVHVRDISERKQTEETIRHLAYHDELTGLPNRRLFEDRLSVELAHSHRHQEKLAVMLLDLDQFKTVNDTLGHAMGDKLLQIVGMRLTGLLRRSDTVARIGGDELLLILSEVAQPDDADQTAQKILEAFREPFVFNDQQLNITISIGVALYPEDGIDSDTLVKNADTAMYRAKAMGRNNFQRYVPD